MSILALLSALVIAGVSVVNTSADKNSWIPIQGCFREKIPRNLSDYERAFATNTVENCARICFNMKFQLAGVRAGSWCLCEGYLHATYHTSVSESKCNAPCSGNSKQMCGGNMHTALYGTEHIGYKYGHPPIGCYVDKIPRDLSGYEEFFSDAIGSPSKCFRKCFKSGFKFVGLQAGGTLCFCGNTYGRYGKANDSKCNQTCMEGTNERCGGYMHNSIYKLKVPGVIFDLSGIQSRGCYLEKISRDFESDIEKETIAFFEGTLRNCIKICWSLGFKFAGLQSGGTSCFCDDELHRYEKASDSKCNEICKDNNKQMCGGHMHRSIYELIDWIPSVGCYNDDYVDGDFSTLDLSKYGKVDENNTVVSCINTCKNLGFKFAGLQASNYCLCGDSYGKYGAANCYDCSMPCNGNKAFNNIFRNTCGGIGCNQIYEAKQFDIEIPSLGCYLDKIPHDLSEYKTEIPSRLQKTMELKTVEICIGTCYNMGFKIAGLQAGTLCFCGDSYGRYGKASDSKCNHRCGDLSWNKCGGYMHNSIYETKRDISNIPFLGCYVDKIPRDLTKYEKENATNTIESCIKTCWRLGYKFTGLQGGSLCFCGETYGRYGKASDSKCNETCKGNSKQICGGYMHNSIYETNYINSEIPSLGCYLDNFPRDLTKYEKEDTSNTIERCIKTCWNFGYRVAGLQAGSFCFCGDTYGRYGKANDSNCNETCKGNSKQICGGYMHNSIYEVPLNIKQRYIGCFNYSADISNVYISHERPPTWQLRAESCRNDCKKKRYSFAGLKGGQHCLCLQDYSVLKRASEDLCNIRCVHDFTTMCGGDSEYSIYATF